MSGVERAELVQRVAGGDADALARLLVEYHGVLRTLVDGKLEAALRVRLDAEDVLQEAYAAAFGAMKLSAISGQRSAECEGAGEKPSAVSHQRSAEREGRRSAVSGSHSARPADAAPSQGHADLAWPRFDSPAAFYGWLERIVLNELHEARRAARRQKRDVGRDAGDAGAVRRDLETSCTGLIARLSATGTRPSRALSRKEGVAAVLVALARLPAEQREVVRWRFLEDVPVADIARRLGKSEMAIYQQCHRGLKALRETMRA